MSIANKIFEKIKEKKVKPKPAYYFWTKEWFLRFLIVLALVFVAFSVAISIYLFFEHDWMLYRQSQESILKQVFMALPYFWGFVLSLFILAACYLFYSTKKGYTHSFRMIIIALLVLGALSGGILYVSGLGEKLDNIMYDKVSYYRPLIKRPIHMWQRPELGKLGGKIIKIEPRELIIMDPKGQHWQVDITDAKVPNNPPLSPEQFVRILGHKVSENLFLAKIILPWDLRPEILRQLPMKK